jgi:hypothetical protein
VKTFGQLHAEQHGLCPEHVERDLLRRCLYPHARLLRGLVALVAPLHFAADFDLVREVAALTQAGECRLEIRTHRHHPAGGGVLRRRFYLRLSTRRLRRLVQTTFGRDARTRRRAEKSVAAVNAQPVGV